MIEIKQVKTQDEVNYTFVEKLMHTAFPQEERRDTVQQSTSFSGGQIPKSIGRLLVPVYAITHGHQAVHQRRASCDAVGIGGAFTPHPAEEIRQGGIGCG